MFLEQYLVMLLLDAVQLLVEVSVGFETLIDGAVEGLCRLLVEIVEVCRSAYVFDVLDYLGLKEAERLMIELEEPTLVILVLLFFNFLHRLRSDLVVFGLRLEGSAVFLDFHLDLLLPVVLTTIIPIAFIFSLLEDVICFKLVFVVINDVAGSIIKYGNSIAIPCELFSVFLIRLIIIEGTSSSGLPPEFGSEVESTDVVTSGPCVFILHRVVHVGTHGGPASALRHRCK